jgi:XTP/dITP diphosphohydrolase
MDVTFASHNAHKREEVTRIMRNIFSDLMVHPPRNAAPEETGETFADNALLKARAAHQPGQITIADDSGIAVDALGGAPGIHSARYSPGGTDKDNVKLLLTNLGDSLDRSARFVCAAVVVTDDTERVVERSWWGRIAREPSGEGGFGYDPIFIPTGFDITAAQLSAHDKDVLSHRGQAFRQLALHLQALSE